MYVKSLTEGYNINVLELRSNSIGGYLSAVNHMYKNRGFKIQVDWEDKSNTSVQFVADFHEWENEPTRHTHMTPEFLAKLIQ